MRDHAKNVERISRKPKPEKLRSKFDFDLWGQKGDEIAIRDRRVALSDLLDDVKKYTLEQTGKRVYSRPLNDKTTALPPVEYPHPGTSYNPTFEDHQALLKKAHDIEVDELDKEAKLRRKLGPMLRKIPQAQKEAGFF